eukprot:Gb_26609 [translate_table: standard]
MLSSDDCAHGLELGMVWTLSELPHILSQHCEFREVVRRRMLQIELFSNFAPPKFGTEPVSLHSHSGMIPMFYGLQLGFSDEGLMKYRRAFGSLSGSMLAAGFCYINPAWLIPFAFNAPVQHLMATVLAVRHYGTVLTSC